MSDLDHLVGATITGIDLADDKKAIRFSVAGRDPLVWRADGDCCSSSWIEHLDNVAALLGATVVQTEDVDMPEGRIEQDYETIKLYGERITTDKGISILEYRNSSNGYYGGSLEYDGPCDNKDHYHHFYGGVYGQNASDDAWKPVVEAF